MGTPYSKSMDLLESTGFSRREDRSILVTGVQGSGTSSFINTLVQSLCWSSDPALKHSAVAYSFDAQSTDRLVSYHALWGLGINLFHAAGPSPPPPCCHHHHGHPHPLVSNGKGRDDDREEPWSHVLAALNSRRIDGVIVCVSLVEQDAWRQSVNSRLIAHFKATGPCPRFRRL